MKDNFFSSYYELRQKHKTHKKVVAKPPTMTQIILKAFQNKQGTFRYSGSDLQKQLHKDVWECLTKGKTPNQVYSSYR